jgi:fido (protein-threonine AMPylation protein)
VGTRHGDFPALRGPCALEALRRQPTDQFWRSQGSAYICDLGTIQPFLAGNEIALHEFAAELAQKNNLSLQWDAAPDIASNSISLLSQAEQSANLRHLIMLAMDADPITQSSSRSHDLAQGMERFLPGRRG